MSTSSLSVVRPEAQRRIWAGRVFLLVGAGIGTSTGFLVAPLLEVNNSVPAMAGAILGFLAAVLLRQWLALGGESFPPCAQPGTLTVILPARNEALTIGQVIAGIPRAHLTAQGWQVQVVVIDDGSTDGTATAARAMDPSVQVVRHPSSRGLGASLRAGLVAAADGGAEAAVYLDADGEYDAAQIERLLAPLLDGRADYVLGSRFAGRRDGMTWSRNVGNRILTAIMSVLTCRTLTDAQSGYRAFSRAALVRAEIIHDYNYAQVLTLDLLRKGARLCEVPIDYRRRQHGASFIRGAEYVRRVAPAMVRELLAD